MKLDIERLKEDIVFREKLAGNEFVFHTTWGLFSPRGIDDGSRLLINYLEVQPDDISLDVGCGYGPLGIVIARQSPQGQVHMVDKDYIAVEFAKKNTELNGLKNCEIYLSNAFSNVPNIRFNNIVSNIPSKVGRELLSIILYDARDHLVPGGRIFVVSINGLKDFIKRNFKEVFGNYKKLKQGKAYTVAMAVNEV